MILQILNRDLNCNYQTNGSTCSHRLLTEYQNSQPIVKYAGSSVKVTLQGFNRSVKNCIDIKHEMLCITSCLKIFTCIRMNQLKEAKSEGSHYCKLESISLETIHISHFSEIISALIKGLEVIYVVF